MVKVRLEGNSLVVELEEEFNSLSTTVLGGGLRRVNTVVFSQVPEDFSEDPLKYSLNLVRELSLNPEETLVFLTATDVARNHVIKESQDSKIFLIVTLGVDPVACVGGNSLRLKNSRGGTVNMFLGVREKLTLRSLAEMLMLAAGVKALAFSDLYITCGNGLRAFASAVDATAVASYYGEGFREVYVGPVSELGSLITSLLYEALTELLMKELDVNSRFKSLTGLSVGEFRDLLFRIYSDLARVPGKGDDEVRELISELVERELRDPNVWLLLASFKAPEVLASRGWVPGLSREEFLEDSRKIVADEVLGIALSEYVNGLRGLMSYYWVERVKGGIKEFGGRGAFEDDLLASFLGSVLSKLLDELLRR